MLVVFSAPVPTAIVYKAPTRGQGIGNMLHGLVTVYTLAAEYNRTICVEWKEYVMFVKTPPTCPTPTKYLSYYNFGYSDDINDIRRYIKHNNIAGLVGNRVVNTAVRFPTQGSQFCNRVGYIQRAVVAHIRAGDNKRDKRGIMKAGNCWEVLRKCLPKNAYIISDTKEAYSELYMFSHARQNAGHSARKRLSVQQLRQTWSEWCTLRAASTMYYTPSGFSESSSYFSDTRNEIRMEEGFSC